MGNSDSHRILPDDVPQVPTDTVSAMESGCHHECPKQSDSGGGDSPSDSTIH